MYFSRRGGGRGALCAGIGRHGRREVEMKRDSWGPIVRRSFSWEIQDAYRQSKRGAKRVSWYLALRLGMYALRRGVTRKRENDRILDAEPPYRTDPRKLIIDVTHFCNLACVDCNRSCGANQAGAKEFMSLEQIDRLIRESVAQGRKWQSILLEGGEPTTHPRILEILERLVAYKREHSPETHLTLVTNGYARGSREACEKIPAGVSVYNSGKGMPEQEHHTAFNMAPADLPDRPPEDPEFRNGCLLPMVYGMGLTRTGFYPHPVCGGIDRVFGFDVGRKSLPAAGDAMTEVYERLCRYCGHYADYNPMPARADAGAAPEPGGMSSSWQCAYEAYGRQKPDLTPY
jgi:hypothetical protein